MAPKIKYGQLWLQLATKDFRFQKITTQTILTTKHSHKAFSVENVFDLPLIRFENLLTKHSSTFDLSFKKFIFDFFFNLTVMGLD